MTEFVVLTDEIRETWSKGFIIGDNWGKWGEIAEWMCETFNGNYSAEVDPNDADIGIIYCEITGDALLFRLKWG